MNKIFVFTFLFFMSTLVRSEIDPFGEGKSPKEIIPASWVRLTVDPKLYNGKVVSIGGWIEFSNEFLLFDTQESLIYNKDLTFIRFDQKSLIGDLLQKKGIDKKSLNGKYVIVTSKFIYLNNDSVLGHFSGPVIIQTMDKSKEISRLIDLNTIWK